MIGPPKRKSPAVPGPGHDSHSVRGENLGLRYTKNPDLSKAPCADIIPFPCAGRTVRAIVIVPAGQGKGDVCRAMLAGSPLHHDFELSFSGPLWKVQMLANDYRRGLPIRVHPQCERRAEA